MLEKYDEETMELRNEKVDIEKEMRRREEEDEVKITENIVDQLF